VIDYRLNHVFGAIVIYSSSKFHLLSTFPVLAFARWCVECKTCCLSGCRCMSLSVLCGHLFVSTVECNAASESCIDLLVELQYSRSWCLYHIIFSYMA